MKAPFFFVSYPVLASLGIGLPGPGGAAATRPRFSFVAPESDTGYPLTGAPNRLSAPVLDRPRGLLLRRRHEGSPLLQVAPRDARAWCSWPQLPGYASESCALRLD
jgi:hypothetical protein